MEVKNFVKIYNDNDDTAIIRQVKTRSFKEDALLKLYKGEQKVEFFSRFENKRSFGKNFNVYFGTKNMFVNKHNLSLWYDLFNITGIKTKVSDSEYKMSKRDLGSIADGEITPNMPSEDVLGIRYNYVYLADASDKILKQIELKQSGLSMFEIDNFLDSIEMIRKMHISENLTFDEVLNILLEDVGSNIEANNYHEFVKILKLIPKFQNMGKDDFQLKINSTNNQADLLNIKQKQ